MGSARFEVPDARPLVDEPVGVRLAGLDPGAVVTLCASATDPEGRRFSSWAEHEADAEGFVDPGRRAPRRGSHDGADPYGLWWSMTAEPNGAFADGVDPVVTALTAEAAGEMVAAVTLERPFLAPGVTRRDLTGEGLVGSLFTSRDPSGAAAVVVGGSGGGVRWSLETAALLASHGITGLALGYFAMPGLPEALREIPLEYVESAFGWLSQQTGVRRIGLVGSSRGAEMALLAASTFPDQAAALVVYGPSAVHWSSGRDPQTGELVPSWTRGGRGLPCLGWNAERARQLLGKGRSMADIFLDALSTGDGSLADATIPVERIRAPLLAITGEDDLIWPSAHFAEMVGRRLSPGVPFEHLVHEHAGHGAGKAPGLPACDGVVRHPIDGVRYATGGTMAGFAAASAAAWPRTLDFLRENLAALR